MKIGTLRLSCWKSVLDFIPVVQAAKSRRTGARAREERRKRRAKVCLYPKWTTTLYLIHHTAVVIRIIIRIIRASAINGKHDALYYEVDACFFPLYCALSASLRAYAVACANDPDAYDSAETISIAGSQM